MTWHLPSALSRLFVATLLGVAWTALIWMTSTDPADAQVPPDEIVESDNNLYVVTDSTQPNGPSPNEPAINTFAALDFTDGDDGEENITTPFAFAFHGTTLPADTTLRVGVNGALLVDRSTDEISFMNDDLMSSATSPMIAPFWDDLDLVACPGSEITHGTFGSSPNRILVIEWDNVCDFGAPSPAEGYTFQVRIFEATSVIEFHYLDPTATLGASSDPSDNGQSATIGLRGGPGLQGVNQPYVQYAFNRSAPDAPIPNGTFAIRFAPCPDSANHMASNALELDIAIDCYNEQKPSGNHEIDITADIVHPSIPPEINGPTTLFVRGNGHVLAGQWDIGSPAANGRDLIRNAGGTTFINALTLANAENHAIHIEDGTVNVGQSTIVANVGNGIQITKGHSELNSVWIQAPEANPIQLDEGSASVFNSYLQTNRGIGFVGYGNFDDTWATIERSEISASSGVQSYGARIAIVNSTIDGGDSSNPGVYSVTGGDIQVTSSTITGFDQGLRADSSVLNVSSSIITYNGDDCVGWGLGNFRVESSFFGDGSCGPDTELLMPANALGDLAPINGCQLALPGGGCVSTRDLGPSNAIGNGDCTDVVTQAFPAGFATGNVETDQRGEPRIAASCDAGAYESLSNPSCTANDFGDVPTGAFYDTPTLWAACNAITTGTSAGIFSPASTVTRAQLATFLWRWVGEPAPSAPNPFTDVPSGAFYEPAVTWLAETRITTGTSSTTFSPQAPITRAQMATFLWRLFGEESPTEPNPFTDNPDGIFYHDAVTWLAETGVTTGTTPTTFSPNQRLNRAQAVTFLYRLQRLS